MIIISKYGLNNGFTEIYLMNIKNWKIKYINIKRVAQI